MVSLTGCGGLLRDLHGKCQVDQGLISKNWLLWCTSCRVRDMHLGIYLAWRREMSHLHVESDSKVLIDTVTDGVKLNGRTPTLVFRISQLFALSWHCQVILSHTWREWSTRANWLANFSYSLNFFDIHILETLRRELQSILFNDIIGAWIPRMSV
jgi:hypothetical protein